jgi:hypothetical protein
VRRVAWTAPERRVLDGLDSPPRIQAFLDSLEYGDEPVYRCPRSVLRDRKAHCFDGAVLAAAALRRLGEPALVVDLAAERDDDHVLAIFRRRGMLGAIAKSNFVGLRYREPVFRTVRELALSYFECYFNLRREKSLRSVSLPVRLDRFDALDWETSDAAMDAIASRLYAVRHRPLLDASRIRGLSPVDDRTFEAHLLGSNPAGLHRG